MYFDRPTIYANGALRNNGTLITEFVSLEKMAQLEFELIEEQQDIEIQEIEELEIRDIDYIRSDIYQVVKNNREAIRELIQAVKRLDRKISPNHCCNCGVELNKENTALPNMCWECKYGTDEEK